MKVSEVIAELKKLDQDKQIFIEYDCFSLIVPIPKDRFDYDDQCNYGGRVKEGDYKIMAW